MIVAIHCLVNIGLPKNITDASTVKNFLVVVTIEHGKGPKSLTVQNMKNWPRALHTENNISCIMICGWRCIKLIKSNICPVEMSAMPKKHMDHKFMLTIMCPDFVFDSLRILSWTAPVIPSNNNDNISSISPRPNTETYIKLNKKIQKNEFL